MDRGNKVQRALMPPRPVRLNVNAEVPTPFVVPWTWYIKQRLYWQLPKLLSVAVSADGQQDEARYAGLVHEDAKFGLSVSFNQTAALDKYAGYHLVSVKKVSHTELLFTLSRSTCPCSANDGAATHSCGCGPAQNGRVAASLPGDAVELPAAGRGAEPPAPGAGTCPHGAGSASAPLPNGHQKRATCKDPSHTGKQAAEIDPSPGPRNCTDRASSGGAPFCGLVGGSNHVGVRADTGKAPSVQGGAAGRSTSRARSGGSGTSGSTHSTATAAGAPGGSADGGLPAGPRPGAGATRGSEDGAHGDAALSRQRRPQEGGLQRCGSRAARCSGTGAEESGSDVGGSDGSTTSSGSEDGDDSDESAGVPAHVPNNPFRRDYCSCPCHVWGKYWPNPDDPAKHQDDLDRKQPVGCRGRRRGEVRSRVRAGSDVDEESDDDDQNDEDWRAGSVARGCKRRATATALAEAERPTRRGRSGGTAAGKPPQPPRLPTAPCSAATGGAATGDIAGVKGKQGQATAAATGLGHGHQRLDVAAGVAAQLPPLPPSAAAISLARRASSGGSAGQADGNGRRRIGGRVGVVSLSKPIGAAERCTTGQPDHPSQLPTTGHAAFHAEQQQPLLRQSGGGGSQVKSPVQVGQQPAHDEKEQQQQQQQPVKTTQGQQSSAQTVITLSDSEDEVAGRQHGACGGSGGGDSVVHGSRGDHVSVEGDERDGRAASDGRGGHSDGDEQPLVSPLADDQRRHQPQQHNAQQHHLHQQHQQDQPQGDCGDRAELGRRRDGAGGTGLAMAALSLSPNRRTVVAAAGCPVMQSQRQQAPPEQTQRGARRGTVAARITAAAAARARRTGGASPTSPGGGAISVPPVPRPGQAAALQPAQAVGAAVAAVASPRPANAAAEATAAQANTRDQPDATVPGHATAASAAPTAAEGSDSGRSAHAQSGRACGQGLVAERVSEGDWADVPLEVARQCGGSDDGVLPSGLQVAVGGELLPGIHPVTWTTPGGEACGSGASLRLHGIPASCAGMQLLGWGSSGQAGVLLLQLRAGPAEPEATAGPAAGRVAQPRVSSRAAAEASGRLKRRRDEGGSDGGGADEARHGDDKAGPALPPRPAGLQQQQQPHLGTGRVEPDRKSRQGAQHKQRRSSGQPAAAAACGRELSLPLPLPPPLVVSLPDRPICRPGWDVTPLEGGGGGGGGSTRLRKGALITAARLPLDPSVLPRDRQGRGTCFMRLFVERDGLLDGYTAAKCVVVEENARGAWLDRLPSHARNCTFLGWGVLPGGSLVLRVESAATGGSGCPAGGSGRGAVWPQPEAVAAAAAAAAPVAVELENRRRQKCEGRFRSPAAMEAAERSGVGARGDHAGPSGGRPLKVVPVKQLLSDAPALPSQLLPGPLRGSGAAGSGRHGPERR